jgi:hypothetical protein
LSKGFGESELVIAWDLFVGPQGSHLIAESLPHSDLAGPSNDYSIINDVDLHHRLLDGPLTAGCR